MRSLLLSTLLLLFILVSTSSTYGQCARWKQDHPKWQLRSGIGLLPTFAKDHAATISPPISLELRYQFNANLSLGLLAGHSVSEVTRSYLTGENITYQNDFKMLALRAGAHTHRWTKWQAYGGIVIGYQNNNIDDYSTNKESENQSRFRRDPSPLFFSAFMGSAYHPIPQLEVFGELGFGLSILTLGVGYSW